MGENNTEIKNEKNKDVKSKKYGFGFRASIVTLFLLIVSLIVSMILRMKFLNIKEIGTNFIDIFYNDVQNSVYLMGILFLVSFIIIFITNLFIKKGLKVFFNDEKKKMPKLLNKSIALFGAIVTSLIGTVILNQNYKMFISNSWFGKTDPIFNNDIAYYIFSSPFIQLAIYFAIIFFICLIVYVAIYYVIVMNMYLSGVDIELLKKNTFLKQIMTIIVIIAILISGYLYINSQNVLTNDMLTIKNNEENIELVGAGKTDVTVNLWGYRFLAIILLFAVLRMLKYIKKSNFKQIVISIAIVPVYLVGLFCCVVYYDHFIVKNEVLDNQKQYISYNIDNTKKAYGIDIEQKTIENYSTITSEEIEENSDVISNIPIVSDNITKQTIKNHQEDGLYYSYDNTFLAMLNSKLVYITPREILSNSNMSYNNRTFKFTHGYSAVISSASELDKDGYIKYILSDYKSNDLISQPRIYFGMETNSIIATGSKFGKEYDYPITATTNEEYVYDGKAGLQLGLWDRITIGLSEKNLKIAFSKYVNKDTKIISNRNIIERAETILPDVIYDDEPYMVITNEGKIVWVLDGYTVSNEYPYSQSTTISVKGNNRKINYIRNSVKVLIDAYDGTTKFYIVDRDDPIIMAYRNLYPTLFEDLDSEIPSDISSQFKYPKKLYDVQAEMIKIYHDISEDVLYRASDVWEITPDSLAGNTSVSGQPMDSYYTMMKSNDDSSAKLGLVVTYNKESKQNIIAYLAGTYENGIPKLSLYKYNSDCNIAGIVQINSQIDQDETIAKELSSLEVSGTKISKDIIIVPINDTLLYVEPVYQVRLNESEIPVLKKVIVASGNKLAIGNNLETALANLFTSDAVDLEVVDMQDINGVIDALIKSKYNLDESLTSKDLEMIGKDVTEIENLINKLEELRENEKLKEKENGNSLSNKEEITNEPSEQTNSIQNNISTDNVNNGIY